MKKVFLLAVLLVVLAAFFASANPDGLEKVAATLGFIDQGVEQSAPMSDYALHFVKHEGLSTAFSGMIGIFLCFGLFFWTGRLFKNSLDN